MGDLGGIERPSSFNNDDLLARLGRGLIFHPREIEVSVELASARLCRVDLFQRFKEGSLPSLVLPDQAGYVTYRELPRVDDALVLHHANVRQFHGCDATLYRPVNPVERPATRTLATACREACRGAVACRASMAVFN